MSSKDSETNTVRLSFRTSARREAKLMRIAKKKGLLNAKGKPNVSAVLNYIIDVFEEKTKRRRRG